MTLRWTVAGVAIVLGTAFVTAQQGARGGEWTRYGGDGGSHQVRAARSDQQGQRRRGFASRGGGRRSTPSISSKAPDLTYSNNFRATPLMIGGVLYSPNGIGLVEAFHPGTGKTLWVQAAVSRRARPGTSRRQHARRGLLDRRHRTASVRHPRRVPDRARPAHRHAADDVRREGPGQSATGSRSARDPVRVDRRRPGLPRRRHRRCRDRRLDVGSADAQGGGAGNGAGVRRAHRQAAVDVQPDSASGRSRQRDLGERLVVVQRRGESVVADQRRRRAGAGLPAADGADQRHVRRPSARRQRLCQHARLRQVPDRRAGLALPDRPPRSVGLRPAGRADPRRHHRRRESRSRRSSSSPSRRSRSSSIGRPDNRSGRSKSGPCRHPTRRANAPRARSRFRPSRRHSIARASRSTI